MPLPSSFLEGKKMEMIAKMIQNGNTALGIELGSTRIKAILLGTDHTPIASGSYSWQDCYSDGIWTYTLENAWAGVQKSYAALQQDVNEKYGVPLETVGVMGISGMMHGYLVFDEQDHLLTPFRTWRNTNAAQAAKELTELMDFNIPMRWSIAQLYQSILDQDAHVKKIRFMTTLAGYMHWQLSGKKVLGIGDASGMFPIDSVSRGYDCTMLENFRNKVAARGYSWDIEDILPTVLAAGEDAGALTEEGARKLDPSGMLQPGIQMAPPEGDAGTGMIATNSVAERSGNVSAGTSIFAMVVLEHRLSKMYPEIDMVTTPSGRPVAMVHCNNCTSDMNAWTNIFREFGTMMGVAADADKLYTALYQKSMEGRSDGGGIVVCNFLAGEPIVGFESGKPFVLRGPETEFTLANFLRAQLYATMAALVLGMRILQKEQVKIDRLTGHGGLFKTPQVGQRYLAAATGSPVTIMKTAGEGGPYGMALLAAYCKEKETGETLEAFLQKKIFAMAETNTMQPRKDDRAGFEKFLSAYERALTIERTAVEISL